METEVQKIVNKNKLSVSRIAPWAKDYIVQRATEEFCGDYGQCLMSMVKECGDYALLKVNFLSGNLNPEIQTRCALDYGGCNVHGLHQRHAPVL